MHEVELVCDRVIFLSRGRLVAQGTPREIIEKADKESLEQVFITIARAGDPSRTEDR
jgi:ABC-2 type transport system ATP-binding protein